MAPGIISDHSESVHNGIDKDTNVQNTLREPLKLSGILDDFGWEDTTPVIGREFPTLNIVDDILNAQNAEDLLRDLAITSKLAHPSPDHSMLMFA